jgi:ribose transport system ATP-binding protein
VEYIISNFNIKAASMEQKICFLSGGNQQKAILSRSISVRPKILILDEPTRGIDVSTKAEIYLYLDKLAKNGLGIILISSEIEELIKVADKIIVIHQGVMKGEFFGNSSNREQILHHALGLK